VRTVASQLGVKHERARPRKAPLRPRQTYERQKWPHARRASECLRAATVSAHS
jgi:hypothetical protein